MKTLFKNDLVNIEYNEQENGIVIFDLVDQNNFPACLTRAKRGIKKAVNAFEYYQAGNASLNFQTSVEILAKFNLRPHVWCMMD